MTTSFRKVICCIALLSLAACVSVSDKPLRWTNYASKEAGFSIEMPGDAVFDSELSDYAFGKRREEVIRWRNPESIVDRLGFRSAAASGIDIHDLIRRYSPDDILDSFVRAHKELYGISRKGRIIAYSDSLYHGYPARHLRSMVDYGKSDSLYVHEMYVLAGERVCRLNARGFKTPLDTISIQRFFNSFRIAPPLSSAASGGAQSS